MTWNTATIIKERRDSLALSQQDLADALQVTKSLISQFESGKREPTLEQLQILSKRLSFPVELLEVGLGRLPEDVRDVLGSKPAEVVAAVRQFCEADAVVYPTQPNNPPTAKEPVAIYEKSVDRPAERIDVQKTSASYRAHSYHTKVPPEAIRPFIRAFSSPGDTVMDPFCGSGMTGVAALSEGRNALLSDLSPAAVHIARNYTAPCDIAALKKALSSVQTRVFPTIEWLYRPLNSDTMVEYTTWSDIFRCPCCSKTFVYWDAVHSPGGVTGDRVLCPKCKQTCRKSDLVWSGEVPVQSHTSAGSNRINSHSPTPAELKLIESSEAAPIPYWTPKTSFGSEREMWRASHTAMGITDVTGFFTKRNLHALAALRHAIVSGSEGRTREVLMFAFTAAVNRASRRYQWNAKRPTNVMTGTLYISSLRYEWNVWSLFRRKAADVLRYFATLPQSNVSAQVYQRSATDLSCLPTGSVDFVFMDPPFGANIFYADSSLLWDAWLGHLTDQKHEIVVNRSRSPASGGKTVTEYGDLMREAFSETSRVLRRGGRTVLAFSNTDEKVWTAIQDSLKGAGYETDSVHVLNKGQPSIKGVKGVSGAENVTTLDLMICLKHQITVAAPAIRPTAPVQFIEEEVRKAVENSAAIGGIRTDGIYSSVLRAAIAANYSLVGISLQSIAEHCQTQGYSEIGGKWIATFSALVPERAFVEGYLASADSLPKSNGEPGVAGAIGSAYVQGGRNSALYTAHSYHTKVPPESIVPFLEHYTKAGDVVLDPFCGSGMTGVACALIGRKAILNDLSPAALHLAWNHTQACDAKALGSAFNALEEAVRDFIGHLYKTTHSDGHLGYVRWVLWSTRHACSQCTKSFLLWDAVDRETGRVGTSITCPHCGSSLVKKRLPVLGSEPAWISYETENGTRHEKPASAEDKELAKSFRRQDIVDWYPTTLIGPDREMYIRCALQLQGISAIADFYTARNLAALARIWSHIQQVPDDRVKRALAFAFTNTAWHGTRMRRFNARGGQRPLTGTLYIPQLSSEANVLEVMRHKIGQLQKYYRSFEPDRRATVALTLGSATHLGAVETASVDYIFTDPPFGSNIFYSDCNLIWESWLGTLTETAREAVVNRSLSEQAGGKSLTKYGSLMADAMKEMHRVLKPGGWATVVFHNTDAGVWQAIHDAAETAGFEFHEASALERKQQSHKGYKGRSGEENVAHFDVVFNLHKQKQHGAVSSIADTSELNLRAMLEEIAVDASVRKRGLQGAHAELMRRLASSGKASYFNYMDVRTVWEKITGSSVEDDCK